MTETGVITRLRSKLAVDAIDGEENLVETMSTGFVWTSRPGTVVLAANRKYFARACANPNVSAIVAPRAAVDQRPAEMTVIVSEVADECFHYLHNELLNRSEDKVLPPQIHPTASIAEGCRIGPGVVIGANVRVEENVVIHGPARIGAGTVIEAGAVIGPAGLFAKRIAGRLVQVRHFGGVSIGEECYIHSGAIIVRSAMRGEVTAIGNRVHVGIMCNIGHDVRVDDEAVLSSNSVIAGRATIGHRAWIGASTTVSNAVSVGADARVNIGAVCIQDVPADAEVSGNFARPHAQLLKEFLRGQRGK